MGFAGGHGWHHRRVRRSVAAISRQDLTVSIRSTRRTDDIRSGPPTRTTTFGKQSMTDAADFRRIALSFEGVSEYPHFDRRAFKARVTFATLAPDELSANFKFASGEQALKCAVAPDAFAPIDNAWGRQGWTRATLAALSEPELRAALAIAARRGAATAKAQARRRPP